MSRRKRSGQPPKTGSVVGISCFSESEFKLLKETAKDRDALDDNYEAWRKNVEGVKKLMREGGIEPVDVELTVAEIELVCQERGLENVGGTRAQIVSEKARALHGKID